MKDVQNGVGETIGQNLKPIKSDTGSKTLSDLKFYNGYSRYNPYLERRETWDESVMRVMDMHRFNPKFKEQFKNPLFLDHFEYATQAYKDKLILASQRTLQFGGDQIMKHNARLYNCLTSYCDRPEFFQECLYWLLCGCGVGFSVQFKHIEQMPYVIKRTKGTKTFQVPDSIEGWSDAIGVLMSSYFQTSATFPEFEGYEIKFDFSLIRPEGAMISGGFKAPGPEGLRKSLIKIEELVEGLLNANSGVTMLPSIVCYDIVMFLSDAVLSGGVRRCLPENYEVQMANGTWKKIQNCKPGDEVLFEGKSYPIENLFKQGEQKLIKINTKNGFQISTPNHKWLVLNLETRQIEWVTAINLTGTEIKYAFLNKKKSN